MSVRDMARLRSFFFGRDSATGFGLMRIAWAAVVFGYFFLQRDAVLFYYSDRGIITSSVAPYVLRLEYRFSIFTWITDPASVLVVYAAFLTLLLWMMIGIFPRFSTIGSVLLLFSFHERNPLILGGGDTVLRTIGFILMLSPGISAVSFRRLGQQLKHFERRQEFLPALTMPHWPRLLLTWQLIVIYLTSSWTKFLGTMWIRGTAFSVILHHPTFSRFPGALAGVISMFSPLFSIVILGYQLTWAILLIPERLFRHAFFASKERFRRMLILTGVLFHVGIFLSMDVGSFSPAMLVAFLGLLRQSDIEAIRQWFNQRTARSDQRSVRTKERLTADRRSLTASQGRNIRAATTIVVLFDSHCRICKRFTGLLLLLDPLRRLHAATYHDAAIRRKYAPRIPVEKLDTVLHVRFPDGRILTGYDAFRRITHHLPPLWPLALLLALPGSTAIGRFVYHQISSRRSCVNGACR